MQIRFIKRFTIQETPLSVDRLSPCLVSIFYLSQAVELFATSVLNI